MGVTVLEAQEMLLNFKISQYPHMKREAQQKVHRQIHQLAYPRAYDPESKAITIAELGKRLASQLGGDT